MPAFSPESFAETLEKYHVYDQSQETGAFKQIAQADDWWHLLEIWPALQKAYPNACIIKLSATHVTEINP